jgi:hypothetical protein
MHAELLYEARKPSFTTSDGASVVLAAALLSGCCDVLRKCTADAPCLQKARIGKQRRSPSVVSTPRSQRSSG